jgi:hypothetical protein
MSSKRATSLMALWMVALLTVVLGWFSVAQGGTSALQSAALTNVPVPAGMMRGPNGAPIPVLQPAAPKLLPGLHLPANAPNPLAPLAGTTKGKPNASFRNSTQISNPIFAGIPNYPAGYSVQSIAVGDVNGDGIPDVVVANYCQSSSNCSNGGGVSVLISNGDGTYQAPVSYASGGLDAFSVALGDFNGDGKLDIAVANFYTDTSQTSTNVSVLINSGDGTFKAPVSSLVAGVYVPQVAIGDFNGDGKLDLAVSTECQTNQNCSNGVVSVLLGNGDGTFSPAQSYSSGGLSAFSVAVADFNGDSKPDLAVVNECETGNCSNGAVGVLLNNGDGTFQAPSSLTTGGRYSFVGLVGDFNGDGQADIAVTNECDTNTSCNNSSVSVFLGNGNGTFSAPVNSPTARTNYSQLIAAGDLNGDGKLDLVIGSNSNNSLQTLLGKGDGTFQASTQFPSSGNTSAVAVADVNADGKLDILAAVPCPNNNCSGTALEVLLGNGDGTFQAPPAYQSDGSQTLSVATADFDADGKPDLVVANNCASNNNCGNGSVGVLLGKGDGTLQPAVSYSSGGLYPRALAVGDFNGDGRPDIVVVNLCGTGGCQNGSLSVLLGNGDGTLQSPITSATGGASSWDVVVGDFNGDRKLDIAVTNHCADNTCQTSSVSVLLGNGDGTFQTPVVYALTGRAQPSIAIADFDGDGKLDLAVSNYCQSTSSCLGVVSILKGNGDGTFQTSQTYPSAGYGTISVAVGDFNGDGKPDLALQDGSDISVLLGNGDGSFQTAVSYPTPCCASGLSQSLLVRDFNGDGSLDLAATTSQGGVNLLLGNGDGTFQTSTSYLAGGNNYGLVAVDLNNDGKPDLAIADGNSPGFVTILLNIVTGFRNATTTTVTSSANPARGGQPVTFTATVTPAFSGPPTGAVTFYDGPNVLGTGSLSGNQAMFTTSSLTVGAHSITASYGGDTNFLPSKSGVLTETITSSPTTTTLASSLNPSTYSQGMTFTATVTPQGPGTPTGTVTFTDGGNTLGASPLNSSGQATFTTSALGAGPHTITASYSGDSGFNPSTSPTLGQTVNQASTALALAASINPWAYSQTVTFTATITPQFGGVATGTVTFKDGATVIGSAAVSGNAAGLTTNALALGTHSITASYSGDSNFTGSNSGVVSQVVKQAATATAVTSSLNPAYLTQSITFTATVTGQYGGLATGSVTFKAGSNTLGTATLNSSGQASVTTSFSTAGPRSITAIYVGDVNYHGSTSSVLTQTVNKFPTTTAVGSSLSPSLVGQSVTFTATVSSTYGSIPNGDKVTFKDGTTVLAIVALSGGTASYTTSSLAAGSHAITASYLGDTLFQISSGTFKQIVNKNPSSAAVVPSLNPSTYGQAVTFTATVSGGAGTATGTVTFKSGTALLGTASLSGGTASITTSTLGAGTHSITAVYSGDSTYLGSTSPAVNQKVNRASTGTSISSSQNPSASGQPVTFTATVISGASGVSGTVTFKSGATVLGTGTLNSSGVATFTTSTLPVGTDPIGASYGGNSNFLPSSASMTQVVTP